MPRAPPCLQDLYPIVDTPEGRAYFPYARLAAGYLVPPSDEAPLKRFLSRLRWAVMAVLFVTVIANPWRRGHDLLALVVATAFYTGIWYAGVAIRCRGFARTRGRMPRLDATGRAAAALSNGFIVYGLVVCLLFALAGSAMFLTGIGNPAMDVVTAVLFGGMWLWYCRIALVKRRGREST